MIGAKDNAIADVSTNPLKTIIIICLRVIFEPSTCWMTKKDGKHITNVAKNRTVTFNPATSDWIKLW